LNLIKNKIRAKIIKSYLLVESGLVDGL